MNVFNEEQKFRQWWLYAILAFGFLEITTLSLWASKKTNEPEAEWAIYIGGGVIALLTCIFWLSNLKTRIDASGITLHYQPFVWGQKQWLWGEVKHAYLRKYSPLWEYGGWGVRHTLSNGKAYNVKGEYGLQLELNNGKKILIGTQQVELMKSALTELKATNHIDCIDLNPAA